MCQHRDGFLRDGKGLGYASACDMPQLGCEAFFCKSQPAEAVSHPISYPLQPTQGPRPTPGLAGCLPLSPRSLHHRPLPYSPPDLQPQ